MTQDPKSRNMFSFIVVCLISNSIAGGVLKEWKFGGNPPPFIGELPHFDVNPILT
jgi:hypothetical protein